MPGRECVILRAQSWSFPDLFRFYGRTCAARPDLNNTCYQPSERQGNQHRQEDARPFLTAAPPGDACKKKPDCEMLRPITEVADLVHHLVRQSILMLGNKIYHGMIE